MIKRSLSSIPQSVIHFKKKNYNAFTIKALKAQSSCTPLLSSSQKFNNNNHYLQYPQSFKYSFSTSASGVPKQQFAKTFLVKIEYTNPQDSYYQTYPHREQFRKQVQQLEKSNKCYVFGGDQFPFQSTTLVINCDEKSLIQNFLNKNIYQKYKLIQNASIEEVEKVSEQKMKKLSYFYQYK